jgi:hypothetical protein
MVLVRPVASYVVRQVGSHDDQPLAPSGAGPKAIGVRMTLLLMTAGTALIGIAAITSNGIRAFDATRPIEATAPSTGAITPATS